MITLAGRLAAPLSAFRAVLADGRRGAVPTGGSTAGFVSPQNRTSADGCNRDARTQENTDMFDPFDNLSTPAQVTVIGRSVHPGYIELPLFTTEILDARGSHDLGPTLDVEALDATEAIELADALDRYERDAAAKIAALRNKVETRLWVLDVTGKLPLSEAA